MLCVRGILSWLEKCQASSSPFVSLDFKRYLCTSAIPFFFIKIMIRYTCMWCISYFTFTFSKSRAPCNKISNVIWYLRKMFQVSFDPKNGCWVKIQVNGFIKKSPSVSKVFSKLHSNTSSYFYFTITVLCCMPQQLYYWYCLLL